MRNLFIMGMLTAGAFMAGWFTIERQGDRTTIEINKSEIRDDTRKAIVRGRDFLERVDQPSADGGSGQWDPQGPAQQPYGQPEYLPAEQIAQQPPWQQQPTWQNDPRYNQPSYPASTQPVNPGAYPYEQPYPQQPR